MSDDIYNTQYWKSRLDSCGGELHRAMFHGSIDQLKLLEAKHFQTLKQHLTLATSIVDIGCGYGRLLDFAPKMWKGRYLGIDFSAEFVNIAKKRHPTRDFVVADFRDLSWLKERFDIAVMIGIRCMVTREFGVEEWNRVLAQAESVAERVLVVEM